MPTPQLPVLTGLDSSPESMLAAKVAAVEAAYRQIPLRLVTQSPGSPIRLPARQPTWRPVDNPQALLHRVARWMCDSHPGLEVLTDMCRGDLADLLVEESRHAALVVVGPGHTGGYDRLFGRWLTHRVVTHTHCPVLLARASITGTGNRPVVVGIDGSERSAAAVPLAFEEAMLRQVTLRAVNIHCVAVDGTVEPRDHNGYDAFTAQTHAERLIDETTARWLHRYPDVKVEADAMYAPDVASALLHAATTADLVVVGTRGRTAITSLLLGTTSRTLVERAPCSVLLTHAHL
jgi:nucleotide-binding universal stress UspA family protein